MPPILRVENVSYSYPAEGSQPPVQALRDVSLAVEPGEYLAIIGHNGSGKSTLARHFNGLLIPDAGDVFVKEWNTRAKANLRPIRTTVGMVFQTPDNQIVATIVEEDVAFGPENLGLPHDELVRRVDWALGQVDMDRYRKRAPHLLSGGQKQRVCIAGVIAMEPEILVLDEATAMLDPLGRREVLEVAHRINREQRVTVIAITHFMREAIDADRVVVLSEGQIALQGTPRDVFAQEDLLHELHLDVPPVTRIANALHRRNPRIPAGVLTASEMVEMVRAHQATSVADASTANASTANASPANASTTSAPAARVSTANAPASASTASVSTTSASTASAPPIVTVEHLTHFYMRDTPLEVQALFDVNLALREGEIVGIMGHTGSGKSTAIQHLNGLLRPHGGRVVILGQDLSDPATDLRAIRRRVGLVFQFPESQLFEQYVGDDIAFGPRKMGLDREEVRARVRRAMESVELGFEEFKDRMSLSLSGGQRRRVAIAGVLALEPEVLVMDEPTAGLDPMARSQLLDEILDYQRQGRTLVLVSHNMDELAAVCDHIFVISGGRTVLQGTPREVFSNAPALREMGLDVPEVTALAEALEAEGLLPPGTVITTPDEAVEALSAVLTATA